MQAAQALSEYELERGKPMPSKNHSLVQSSLIAHFLHCGDEHSVLSELTLDLPERESTPDISVYPKLPRDWQHDEVKMSEPPPMVVEILPPTQALGELILKADAYFAAGVRSCWIVQPMLETIAVLQPGTKPQVFSSGEVRDPATGITVTVEEIFR